MVTKGERGVRDKLGVCDEPTYTTMYIKQINNKVLLYSTGNYIQYLIITYNGKKSKKEYTYITENHFDVHPKLTQQCKSTILQ